TGTSDWGSTPYIYVMRRDYNGGAAAVLMRTAHGTANYTGDSVLVDLGAAFREVNANGDTAVTAVTSTYLKPYMGKIFVIASACASPPSIPTISSPTNGGAAGTTTPTLCVNNSNPGACPDPVQYQFEIASDLNFTAVVRQSAFISQGTGTTCFTTTAPLDNGRRYYWRGKATNGTATSGWAGPFNFTTPNTLPAAPANPSPTSGSTVTTYRPSLVIDNVTDPDGTAVTYYFEVSKFSNFSTLAAQSGAITAGNSTTSWQVGATLENGSAYFWRVRANDGIGYGPWAGPWTFTVSVVVVNNPPTTPAVYSPPSGATVTFVPVALTWYNSTDPDGNQLTYQLHLFDSTGTTLLDSTSGIQQGSGPTSSYSPQYQFANGVWCRWLVRAYDGQAYSGWMTPAVFLLDTLFGINQPPQSPELVSPNDFDTLTSLQVSLTTGPAYDPESDTLTYDFAVYSDADQTQLVDQVEGIEGMGAGNNITWAIPQNLSSGRQYFWSCRAYDGEKYSEWAAQRCFWAFDFSVNADQESPVNLKPRSGSTVKITRPTLEVTNVVSNLPENLYYFEVSEDPDFINRIYSGPVEEDISGSTSWTVSVPLTSGTTYYWRSRANNSPYSATFSLAINAEVYMAPNPFKGFKRHNQVRVINMAPEGTLTITTLTNQPVRVLNGNSDGIVYWDVTDSNGRRLGSDVYLCYYQDGERQVNFKFAVIR
ncbi:MAG: hypothetical protein PHR28_10025, partial [candidate division Zixibacteria bacterium]|nr:hypothetical protein [candidate division Zixibacteria bacterium]